MSQMYSTATPTHADLDRAQDATEAEQRAISIAYHVAIVAALTGEADQ